MKTLIAILALAGTLAVAQAETTPPADRERIQQLVSRLSTELKAAGLAPGAPQAQR